MNIVVPVKLVPDLVEELEIDDEGTDLDRDMLSFRINEFDDHALEEALQLKDGHGATVTVIALDGDETDKVLYTALAKGADRAIKITGPGEALCSHGVARAMGKAMEGLEVDLILTGVQAADDRDGQLGVLLAAMTGRPHLSAVSAVEVSGDRLVVHKEYSGGVMAKFDAPVRVVLGIQAARETPRYAPVSRVRQIMKESELEEIELDDIDASAGSSVRRMLTPEKGEGAEMIEGDEEEIADRLVEILKSRGS